MPAQDRQKTEQSLSDLAIAEVGSKLPKLMQSLVGFEVVEVNDEATRAAGILAFELGGNLVYSPVLFLNGRIKAATDVLYLSDADVFTSATPAWVEYLSSRGAGVTGKAKRQPAGAATSPGEALRIFNRPPQVSGASGKFASAQPVAWGSRSAMAASLPCEFRELFTWWTRPDAVNKTAALGDRFTVREALRSLGPVGYGRFIADLTGKYPEVLEKFAELHGGLDELFVEFPPETPKTAAPVLPTLSFADHRTLEQYPDALDVNQKTAVLATGLCVIDKRAKDEKAHVFDDDYVGKFQTPAENGYYEIFNDQGALEKVYVGLNPFFLDKPDKKLPVPMIIDPSGDGAHSYYLPKDGEAILARARLPMGDQGDDERDESIESKFKRLTLLEDVTATHDDDRYVAVSPSGVTSAPFEVKNVIRKDGLTTLVIHTDDDMEPRLLVPPSGDEATGPDDVTFVRLVDSGIGSERITARGTMVYVPKTYRVMRVKELAKDDYSGKIRPGNVGLLHQRSAHGMGMRTADVRKEAGAKFVVRQALSGVRKAEATSRPLTKEASLKLLIGNLGFGEEDARSLLADAEANGAGRRWFLPPAGSKTASKSAQLLPGTPFPVHDDEHDTDEYGRPVQQPVWGAQEIGQERPAFPTHDEDPDAPGRDPAADALGAGFGHTNRGDMDLVMRAANGGESVFDTQMIGAILKCNRTAAQIDNWLAPLSGALDTLCRLLLLFYWKNSDWGELYGKDELALAESNFLENIKVMGETVLFLKQRSAESSDRQTSALED